MDENAIKSEEKADRAEDGKFLEGHGIKSPGRPPGSLSIKEQIKKRLEEHPEEVKEIVEHFIKNNRELMWQMLEGKPKQQMEVDVDKDTLAELTQFFRAVAKPKDGSS